MDLEKQKLLVGCLSANRDLMSLTAGMIQPSYFDPALRKPVKFILDYFGKYKDVPKTNIIRAETGVILDEIEQVSRAEVQFISTELEKFCQERAAVEAVQKGPEFLQKGDVAGLIGLLKSATTVGLQKDLGIDYFADPESRLKTTLENQARVSTGIAELDDLLGGGLARQELITFLANSGGGKSMNMLNLCHNLLKQGLNGVYFTLEMAEGVVSKRLDSMISRVAQGDLFKELNKVSLAIQKAGTKMGQFRIKRFPEGRSNINHFKSYLQQLEQSTGFRPDFICIDYIDITGSTSNVQVDNLFLKDKYVTEEIRSLGFDYDAIMISAAQLGRGAIEAEQLTQAHIQGGISKINTSDWTIGIQQSDLMKSAGEIYYSILKARNSNGVGKKILLAWDPISLTVSSLGRQPEKLELKKSAPVMPTGKTVFSGQKPQSPNILNLFEDK
jgi:archaellum biogenesis ATPase FlaH